jgi:RNA polymerase sigma-70 factor (ECF subfamily)
MAHRLLRNTPDAQDLVQDVCVTAYARLADIDPEAPLRWLLCVLHNRFIDGQRRRSRSPLVAMEESVEVATLPSDTFDPEDLLQQYQSERALEQAWLQLTDTQRTLLALRAEGYELPEIETITGIERKVLSARLNRARVALSRNLIEQKGALAANRRAGSKA